MKKAFILLTVFVIMFMSPACLKSATGNNAGNQGKNVGNTIVPNRINLAIDKNSYVNEGRIDVTLDFRKLDKENAVILIIASEAVHGSKTPLRYECEDYRLLSEFSKTPFYIWAPSIDGTYDIRVYSAEKNGDELGCMRFTVGSAT